jgi:hypothetical protein
VQALREEACQLRETAEETKAASLMEVTEVLSAV